MLEFLSLLQTMVWLGVGDEVLTSWQKKTVDLAQFIVNSGQQGSYFIPHINFVELQAEGSRIYNVGHIFSQLECKQVDSPS